MDGAVRHDIKIAWRLESYRGRTAASTVAASYVFDSLSIPDGEWLALDAVTGANKYGGL